MFDQGQSLCLPLNESLDKDNCITFSTLGSN